MNFFGGKFRVNKASKVCQDPILRSSATTPGGPGVDVMITIFGEKIGVFLKYQCYDQLFSRFSFVLSQKCQFFSQKFSAKIFFKIITSVPD
jgi:hypothetical protein